MSLLAGQPLRAAASPAAARDRPAVLWRAVTLAASGVVAFIYVIDLTILFNIAGKPRDILLFLAGAVAIPLLCGVLYHHFTQRRAIVDEASALESLVVWSATGTMLLLVIAQHAAGVFQSPEIWRTSATVVLLLVPLAHVAAAAVWIIQRSTSQITGASSLFRSRSLQGMSFALALTAFVVSLFWFEPGGRRWSGLIAYATSLPFASARPAATSFAATLSVVILLAIAAFSALDRRLLRGAESHLRRASWAALIIALVSIAFLFDFSLDLEVLHYLTNVGPAMHMRHGGNPLVNAFSQYGPIPSVATYLAYRVAPLTLGTAQIIVQIFNLSFCALWLICLWRMSRFRIAAMALGLIAIAIQYAVWDFGNGNINIAPSILGLRYMPTLLLVLSLSFLRPPARHSLGTWLALALSTMWSLESLIGTVGVYAGFLLFLGFRDRAPKQLLRDALLVLIPILLMLAGLCVLTWLTAGGWPRFDLYLSFFSTYNPLSNFWAHPAAGGFFGWIVPMLVVFLTLAEAARRAACGRFDHGVGDDEYFYRFVPMALFVIPLSAYFAFRSYDYTLSVALLPTCALLIAAGAPAIIDSGHSRRNVTPVLAIPAILGLAVILYTCLALGRERAPYSTVLHECRDHNRCTPAALAKQLRSRAQIRHVLEPTGQFLSDRYREWLKPSGVIAEAIDIIRQHAADHPRVTVLAGNVIASELTLLYTNKWQHFPISFAYTDGLSQPIADSIVTAPVDLPAGALIVVGQDEAMSELERRVWLRIQREFTLCRLSTAPISAYRVAGKTGCGT